MQGCDVVRLSFLFFLRTGSSVAKQAEASYLSLPGYHLDAPFRSSEFLKLGRISLSTVDM